MKNRRKLISYCNIEIEPSVNMKIVLEFNYKEEVM